MAAVDVQVGPRPPGTRRRLCAAGLVAALCSWGCGGGAEATAETGPALAPGECRFARMGDPDSFSGGRDLVNAPSERLAAPPGGLWWITSEVTGDRVTAQVAGRGSMPLVVVRPNDGFSRLAAIRVPQELKPGTRVELASRELSVVAPGPRFDVSGLAARYAHRPDLGGTGLVVRVDPAQRTRIFIEDAWVGSSLATVHASVHVLQGLLLADVGRICHPPEGTGGEELFVPLWGGETRQALAVRFHDADDVDDRRFVRLCMDPAVTQSCVMSIP